ncbi:MAG: D-alanyl-D-alanine carboxypeptidase [Microbacterium sp.]
MTSEHPPAPSRRALRDGRAPGEVTGETATLEGPAPGETATSATPPITKPPYVASRAPRSPGTAAAGASAPAAPAAPAPVAPAPVAPAQPAAPDVSSTPAPPVPVAPPALTWVTESTLRRGPASLTAGTEAEPDDAPDLLARRPRRSPLRPGVVIPTLLIAGVLGVYTAGALLWPLHEVAPTVEAMTVEVVPAAVATPPWPPQGSASVSVAGIPGTLATTADPLPMASITKVVTALVVLEEMPLAVGEQGPEYRFSARDRSQYWSYRENGESALDVPVGGALTEYQLLQGMLMGSAGNYADRLASNLWPTDAVFAAAANSWLRAHGVSGVTVVEPTGMDPRNVATPEALLVLAQKALANPVIAGIVATPAVELPGAGLVTNTNGLLADPGVIGVKTGSLDTFNLLSAKNITIGDTVVRTYASVLGQPDDAWRVEASRALYAQLEAELQPVPSVTAGTTVGRVTTEWGQDVSIVTGTDASVILWNGGSGTPDTTFSLGDARAKGAEVGSLTVTGPLDRTTVELRLGEDIEPPSAWWRLTHPLALLGLD